MTTIVDIQLPEDLKQFLVKLSMRTSLVTFQVCGAEQKFSEDGKYSYGELNDMLDFAGGYSFASRCPDIRKRCEFLVEFWGHVLDDLLPSLIDSGTFAKMEYPQDVVIAIRDAVPFNQLFDAWNDGVPMEDLVA